MNYLLPEVFALIFNQHVVAVSLVALITFIAIIVSLLNLFLFWGRSY